LGLGRDEAYVREVLGELARNKRPRHGPRKTKRAFLDEWVKAVNDHGGFGHWQWAVSSEPGDVVDILRGA
jgi:hypothetical protein